MFSGKTKKESGPPTASLDKIPKASTYVDNCFRAHPLGDCDHLPKFFIITMIIRVAAWNLKSCSVFAGTGFTVLLCCCLFQLLG